MKNTVILTDVDGVLLNYVYAFEAWASKHGIKPDDSKSHIWDFAHRYDIHKERAFELIKMFNESAAAGFMPPWRDSIKYVRKLHEEHGYVFHAITSFGTDRYSFELRKRNLETLFGVGTFEKITCLPVGFTKQPELEKYKDTGCFWIEDHPTNCTIGTDLGLQGLLMYQDYNRDDEFNGTRVANWKEAYSIITGQ